MSQIEDFLNSPSSSNGKADTASVKPVSDEVKAFLSKRTTGEAIKDVGLGLAQGAAGLVKSAGDAYGLATGDMDNAVSKTAGGWQESLDKEKSAGFHARAAQRKANIDAQDSTLGKAWTAVKDTVTDPALALDTVATNVSTLLPGAAAGRIVAGARMAQAARAGLTGEAAAAAAMQAGKAGTAAAIGTGAAQQATDVSAQAYEDNNKKSEAVWDANADFQAALAANGGDRAAAKHALSLSAARAAFGPAAAISLAANAIPGGAMLEKALVGGAAREVAKEGARFAVPKAIAKGALGEAGSEAIEEGGGQYAANVAAQHYIDPNQDLMDGVGENAGLGAAGGLLLGGAGGAFHGHRPAEGSAQDQQNALDAANRAAEQAMATPGGQPAQQWSTAPGAAPEGGEQQPLAASPINDPRLDGMSTSPGAAQAQGNEVDFQREIDTTGLSLARKPEDGTEASNPPAPDGPAKPLRPSEAMGLRSGPAAGTLENAAALAVDTGVHHRTQQEAAIAQAAAQQPLRSDSPLIDYADLSDRDRALYDDYFNSVEDGTDDHIAMAIADDDSFDIPDFGASSNVTEDEFLRHLGASEQEIADVLQIARGARGPQESLAGHAQAQGNVTAGTPANAGSVAQAQAQQEVADAFGRSTEQTVEPGANAAGANLATLAQLNRKQLPDMSNAELQQLAGLLPADHKRQPKIANEIQKRAQQAQSAIKEGAEIDGTQTTQAQQAAAKSAQAGTGAGANPADIGASVGTSEASTGAGQADGALQPAAGAGRYVGNEPGRQGHAQQAAQPGAEPAPQVRAGHGQGSDEQARGVGGQPTGAPGAGVQGTDLRAGGFQQGAGQGVGDGTTTTQDPGPQADTPAAPQAATQSADGPARAQRIAEAGTQWAGMPAAERSALAGRLDGVGPVIAKNLHKSAWERLGADMQHKIADALVPETQAVSATVEDGDLGGDDAKASVGHSDKPPPKSVPERMRAAKSAKTVAKPKPSPMQEVQQGVLENRIRQKQEAWEKVKRLREGVKNGTANRLQLLKAEDAHKQLVRDVASFKPATDPQPAQHSTNDVPQADDPSIANHEGAAQRRPASAQDKAVMQAIADGKSARDVLRLIASKSKDPLTRQVARLLLKAGITPKLEFGHIGKSKKGDPIHGQYRGKSDTIVIAGSAEYAAERIFMHEAMHAATMRALAKRGLAKLQMEKLLAHVRKQKGAAGFYGITNVDEFVAEVFTNPDFQQALRGMSAPAGGAAKSAWDGFVRILRSILGLPNDSTNALSQALQLGVVAMREDMALRKASPRASSGLKLRGNTVAAAGVSPLQLRAKTVEWAKQRWSEGAGGKAEVVHNSDPSFDKDVRIAWQGVKHAIAGANQAELRLIPHVAQILSRARYLRSEEDRAGRAHIKQAHFFEADVSLDGERLAVGLVVHEKADGQLFYDQFIVGKPRLQNDAPPHGTSGNGMPGISDRSVLQPSSGGESILTGNAADGQGQGEGGVLNFGTDDIARGQTAHKGNDIAALGIENGPVLSGLKGIDEDQNPLPTGTEPSKVSVADLARPTKIEGSDADSGSFDPGNADIRYATYGGKGSQDNALPPSARKPLSLAAATQVVRDLKVKGVDLAGITVVKNPEALGWQSPPEVPMGATTGDGRVFVFSDGHTSAADLVLTVFHELFHSGVVHTARKGDYVGIMLDLAKGDKLIAQRAASWKKLGVAKEAYQELAERYSGQDLENRYEALAVEEALATIAEDLARNNFQSALPRPLWVRKVAHALAKLADAMGMQALARTIRGYDYTRAERFVLDTIRKADTTSGSGPNDGPGTRVWRTGGKGGADTFAGMAQAVKGQAMNYVHDAMSQAPGTVHWWHKTVGTMNNLAERNPAFKPVFDAAQQFTDDVSSLANDVANQAPRLIPRLESLSDLKFWGKDARKPISAEDNKAIAKPLFEGTLMWTRDIHGKPITVDALEKETDTWDTSTKEHYMIATKELSAAQARAWQGMPLAQYEKLVTDAFKNKVLKPGIRWTEAELRSMFQLTDGQLSLFNEARTTIDSSIDKTARADMMRMIGEEYRGMRDAVMDAPTLDDALTLVTRTLQDEANASPDNSARLMELHNAVVTGATKARDLVAKGYAPLSRFGSHTVDVLDAKGERLYFGLFETAREADAMQANMAEVYKGEQGVQIGRGTLSKEEYKLFAGVTPESLEAFGTMLGLDAEGNEAKDAAFQEYIRRTKNNHSALKRLIHRKGIAGYSQDVGRVLASFVYSNARQGAGALNAGIMEKAIQEIPKQQGQLRDVAMGLRSYIQDPQEEGQAVRGFLFAQYLGGSVASAVVNMMQPVQITFPWLSQYGGAKQSAAALTRAMKDMATKGYQYEPALAKALKRAEDEGTVSPQEIHQLMAQARGEASLRAGDGTKLGDAKAAASNAWRRTVVAWGQPFAWAEQLNRRSTFIAAYRIAVAQKMADPDAFAAKAVKETQFQYSKANKMRWGRGAIGGTLMTFKSYSVSYLELMGRMWNAGTPGSPERAQSRKALLMMVGMLALMGGAGGLPFVEDVEDLVNGLMNKMGYNWDSKQARKQFLQQLIGQAGAEFINSGISGLPGMPIDVAGRLGMGNLIPGTGIFGPQVDKSRDMLEIVGPAGDFVKRIFNAGGMALGGNVGGAALEVSPGAVRNWYKGYEMATSGMYKDAKGYKVIDTTLGEALAKFSGFQPRSVADVQEANGAMQKSRSFYTQQSAEIKAQWADALFRKDEGALERVRERLASWNRKNPDMPIVVRMPEVWKKVREMGKDKQQRIADTAPKALRQQMRQMAAEAGH